MPNRVEARGFARSIAAATALCIAIAIGVSIAGGLGMSLGCNATCIRDSDCLGHSVCTENRCLLIAGRDAGNSSTPIDEPSDDGSAGSAGSGGDGAGGSDVVLPGADAGN